MPKDVGYIGAGAGSKHKKRVKAKEIELKNPKKGKGKGIKKGRLRSRRIRKVQDVIDKLK